MTDQITLTPGSKICFRCKENKSITSFYKVKANKSGYAGTCKKCKVLQASIYQKKNSKRTRNNHYKRTYGITLIQYEEMESLYMGVCGCCGNAPEGRYEHLAVDHCHETKEIRGLLCASCNKAIGALGDSVEGLKRALSYLEIYE